MKIWSPTSGRDLLTLEGNGIGFSADGQRILSISGNTWKIWQRAPADVKVP